jgi:D-tyrosyl-tRNA(Tyr) deacylase
MRILLQRVSRARVLVDDVVVGQIGPGLVLLVGIHHSDSEDPLRYCAEKCAHLRIFADEAGKMNLSVLDVGGQIMAISQFTLYGDSRKGRRPSFDQAAPPAVAEPLYERFIQLLEAIGLEVARGVFGAHMVVDLDNDGPVTLIVESP